MKKDTKMETAGEAMPLEPKAEDTPAAASSPPPSGPRLAHEAWAEKKGYLPQFFAQPTPVIDPSMMGFPAVGVPMGKLRPPRPNQKYGEYAAAKVAWVTGKEMTEAEFDAAVQASGEHVAR